ncbi:putative virion structural protein [Photobacterium phage PDCC-1]|uniref:Putative virion structural protein n=1 Tax=Photobacterium phage PDCC-1 TaxID=2664246 RepID=A0A6B9J814_9CAUD|nr:putative virion structural protein [Photobacterium phage PDCC-1]QGZ14391.1 putative virion structural protein [Photobacterium phage PDCC-1]
MNDTIPAVDLTNVDLLTKDLGEPWINFTKAITPENAELIQRVYTLLVLADEENVLVSTIANILSDDDSAVVEQKAVILELLLNNIIEQLVKFGITIDLEYVEANKLDTLYQITDVIYLLNGYEDLQSLSEILEQRDLSPKDRFIEVFRKLYDYEPTTPIIEDLEYLILECSEYLMETLRISLIVSDGVPDVPEFVKLRIKTNVAFLEGTVAAKHVRNNGQLGMGFLTLLGFYALELDAAMKTSPEHYIKELFGFSLISETPNDKFWDQIKQVIEENVEEVTLLYRAERLAEEIMLPEGVKDDYEA